MKDKSQFRIHLIMYDEIFEDKQDKTIKEMRAELIKAYKTFYDTGFAQGINFAREEPNLEATLNKVKTHLVNLYDDYYVYGDEKLERLLEAVYNKGYIAGNKKKLDAVDK